MTDKKSTAKKALRSLHHALCRALDPSLVSGFFAEGLITDMEKQTVEAEPTNINKINRLLDFLRKRDSVKVIGVLIQLLEGDDGVDKEANEEILRKIEKCKQSSRAV